MAYDKKCWTYIVLKRRPIDDLKKNQLYLRAI